MALPYIRVMPGSVARQTFEPRRIDFSSPVAGGAGGGVTAGFPRWAAKWTLGVTSPRQADQWRAFLASLRGSQRLFFGRDFSRPFPAYYASGLPQSWNGDLSGWSVSLVDGDPILNVQGLPGGMGVAAGDYIGFRWLTGGLPRAALVRCLQDVPSSGGAASFPIDPAVPTLVPANATAYMKEAGCHMRLVSSETQVAEMLRARRIEGTTLSGLQELQA